MAVERLFSRAERAEIIKVLCLCVAWYCVSSSNGVVGKMLLNDFPYPMSLTLVQLLSITCLSGPALRMMGVTRQVDISWSYYKKLVIPLAFGKFIASVFSHVSLWKVPVSYAHTVKATMPLFTVLLCRIFLKERQTLRVYASLVPIILGVAIASISELSFDALGLICALMATCAFSLQNIFSKKVLADTGLHPLRLVFLLGRLSLIMFLPFWLIFDGYAMLHDSQLVVRRSGFDTLVLLGADGVLNWLQNLIAFSILHRVAPLTYAVANVSKRVAIISVSLLVLNNPVTPFNVLGMMLAILGVLAYNKAKYDANRAKKVLLPVSSSFSNGMVAPALHQVHPAYPYDYSRLKDNSLRWPSEGTTRHPTNTSSHLMTAVSLPHTPYIAPRYAFDLQQSPHLSRGDPRYNHSDGDARPDTSSFNWSSRHTAEVDNTANRTDSSKFVQLSNNSVKTATELVSQQTAMRDFALPNGTAGSQHGSRSQWET